MAFALANFAPAGNQSKPLTGVGTSTLTGAPSLWTYATADAVNTVSASGYFNTVSGYLNVGDVILAACGAGSGGTLASRLFLVVSNSSGVVDVADGTTITPTDTY